jgi:hypothetical protein
VETLWGRGEMSLLNKLLEYIDAAIDGESSDGGLIEKRVKFLVRDELFELLNKEEAK